MEVEVEVAEKNEVEDVDDAESEIKPPLIDFEPAVTSSESMEICAGKVGHERRRGAERRDARPFQCVFCQKTFAQKHHLKSHLSIYSEQQLFECQVCNWSTQSKDDFQQHISTHSDENPFKCEVHSQSTTKKIKNEQHKNHCKNDSDDKPFKCEICNKRFSD